MTTLTNIKAYAAPAEGQPLTPTTIERRPVGANDVLIEISYAGICHSDIHTVRGEWGPQAYPLTPGHEIAGVVAEVGSDVTKFKTGTGSASAAWSTPAATARTAATATSSTA